MQKLGNWSMNNLKLIIISPISYMLKYILPFSAFIETEFGHTKIIIINYKKNPQKTRLVANIKGQTLLTKIHVQMELMECR